MKFKMGEVIYKVIDRLDGINSAEDWAKVNTAHVVLSTSDGVMLVARLRPDALKQTSALSSPYVLPANFIDEDAEWRKSQHEANVEAAKTDVRAYRREVEEAQKDLAAAEEKLAWLLPQGGAAAEGADDVATDK